MSRDFLRFFGNGKIDRTPSPVSLKKIKRVSFNVFLGLKEFVDINSVKVIRLIPPGRDRKKSVLRRKRRAPVVTKNCVNEYEPSAAVNANSSLWKWHRVDEWHEYINDTGRTNKRDT